MFSQASHETIDLLSMIDLVGLVLFGQNERDRIYAELTLDTG